MCRRVALIVAVALVAFVGISQAETKAAAPGAKVSTAESKAKPAAKKAWAPHRGHVATTKGHLFETVFTAAGLQIYVYNLDHSPVTLPSGVTGTATLKLSDGTTKVVPLSVATDVPAGEQSRISGATDVLGPKTNAKIDVQLHGLEGAETDVTFYQAYHPRRSHTSKSTPAPATPSKAKESTGSSEKK